VQPSAEAQTGVTLSIVIPAYNEAANVPIVVEEAEQGLEASTMAGRWQIILVDDGSTDGTAEVVDDLARRRAHVQALHHPLNRGLGAALKTGYAAARGEYVTLITGDGEIGVEQPLKLLSDMADADLMISRRVRPADASRTVLSTLFGWLTRLLTGFDSAEISGVYVIRRDLLSSMPLRSNTGVLNFEVIIRATRLGRRIGSGYTEIRPRLSGTSKVTNVRTVVKVVWELVTLRFALAAEQRS
jgi:glycosyltransferase involved in cell wall biosynthesis